MPEYLAACTTSFVELWMELNIMQLSGEKNFGHYWWSSWKWLALGHDSEELLGDTLGLDEAPPLFVLNIRPISSKTWIPAYISLQIQGQPNVYIIITFPNLSTFFLNYSLASLHGLIAAHPRGFCVKARTLGGCHKFHPLEATSNPFMAWIYAPPKLHFPLICLLCISPLSFSYYRARPMLGSTRDSRCWNVELRTNLLGELSTSDSLNGGGEMDSWWFLDLDPEPTVHISLQILHNPLSSSSQLFFYSRLWELVTKESTCIRGKNSNVCLWLMLLKGSRVE